MGRAKPNALKKLSGSRHYNPSAPKPPGIVDLRLPRGLLSPAAQKFWKEHGETLAQMGVLTAADLPAFALLCETWALTWAAIEELRGDGLVVDGAKNAVKKSPAAQLVRDFSTQWAKLAGEFGMLPATRSRLSIEVAEAAGGDLAQELMMLAAQMREAGNED